MTAGLDARIRVRRGELDVQLDLMVGDGEVVALLGPNGAGKSTVLRVLAGLLPVDEGSVRLAGKVLDDPATTTLVGPAARQVGLVHQDHQLFGHLSVLENVAFGLRARGSPKAAARATARAWVDRVGLAEHLRSRPGQLSGGQAQRVALARALAVDPLMLLLDEPLSALDAGTRLQVRADLRHHLARFDGPCVLVTHDAVDAMVLADRLVVLEHGDVVQEGRPVDVARAPRTDYVARLVGLNLLAGIGRGAVVTLAGGHVLHVTSAPAGDVFVAFPPSAVTLYDRRPEGVSARNLWPATVLSAEPRGDAVRVRTVGSLGGPDVLADVTTAALAELHLAPGVPVWVGLKATETVTYPA